MNAGILCGPIGKEATENHAEGSQKFCGPSARPPPPRASLFSAREGVRRSSANTLPRLALLCAMIEIQAIMVLFLIDLGIVCGQNITAGDNGTAGRTLNRQIPDFGG